MMLVTKILYLKPKNRKKPEITRNDGVVFFDISQKKTRTVTVLI